MIAQEDCPQRNSILRLLLKHRFDMVWIPVLAELLLLVLTIVCSKSPKESTKELCSESCQSTHWTNTAKQRVKPIAVSVSRPLMSDQEPCCLAMISERPKALLSNRSINQEHSNERQSIFNSSRRPTRRIHRADENMITLPKSFKFFYAAF